MAASEFHLVTNWSFATPLPRPMFTGNHNKVIGWGFDGLTRKLASE